MVAVTQLGPGGYPVAAPQSAAPPPVGGPMGFRAMAHFWMGGAAGVTFVPPAAFPGFRSLAHFWMGGISGASGVPPPVGGFLEPTYFIANCGRMMNRRGA